MPPTTRSLTNMLTTNRKALTMQAMAKFNCGQTGGIYYKVLPTGWRRYIRFGPISPFPYVLGYDIKAKLTIKSVQTGSWWPHGILDTDEPTQRVFTIGSPDSKGKWSDTLLIGHPTQPCVFSSSLILQVLEETDNPRRTLRNQTLPIYLIEDIRVIPLTTALAWAIPTALAIIGLIIGIIVA